MRLIQEQLRKMMNLMMEIILTKKTNLRITLIMGILTRRIENLIRGIKVRIGLKELLYLVKLFITTYTVHLGLKTYKAISSSKLELNLGLLY
ncbi:protein of unknown function [Clostridium beijerinckii]|nr:protein of unknown function [Clostridium beijerinckii]